MQGWIQIFRAGKQTDSSGNERNFERGDLDRIVSSYDPRVHEAPVVIGHPKENAPAFGWVESLKREGDILFARLKDLVPEFVDMVKKGLFKKRSIALNPDLSLRHVGFLGAMPPAVKGLEDIRFQEGIQITIDFSAQEIFHNSMKGETDMSERKFSDPGEELHRRALEAMKKDNCVDRHGKRMPERMTYGQALSFVYEEDPELAKEYYESTQPKESEKHKKAMAAGEKMVKFVEDKRRANPALSYSDALDEVCKEKPELIREYLDQ